MKRMLYLLFIAASYIQGSVLAQTISSFSPTSGNVGTPVTITGSNLNTVTSVSINGTPGVILDKSSSSLSFMVMPGSTSGVITLAGTSSVSSSSVFGVTTKVLDTVQQGGKLVGSASDSSWQGSSVALSANGGTLAVGAPGRGCTYVFIRVGTNWVQQAKLTGTGGSFPFGQGSAVALSADGNTLASAGIRDSFDRGATWIFTRTGSTWSQQGNKLVGTGAYYAAQGYSVALSADGNTLAVGGPFDTSKGATWIFTRTGSTWSQQGQKLVGTGADPYGMFVKQGTDVSLSADGNTLAVGGPSDSNNRGATWIFTRNNGVWGQQGSKLIGRGNYYASPWGPNLGSSVALSANGNTLAVGSGYVDVATDATVCIFDRDSNNVWKQKGGMIGPLSETYYYEGQTYTVSLSGDGRTLAIGGFGDTVKGATWVYRRETDTSWVRLATNKLIGTGGTDSAYQGFSVALSADGKTLAVGGYLDNHYRGATWIFSSDSTAAVITAGVPGVPQNPIPVFWPNPVMDKITVSGGPAQGVMYIIDAMGRTVANISYRREHPVDVSDLVPGVYWVRLDNGVAAAILKQ